MKNIINKKAAVTIISVLMSITVLVFGMPAIPGTLNVYAAESNVGAEVLIADSSQDEVTTGAEMAANSDKAAADGAESAEDLSFTERIAARFATSLGKYIPAELIVVFVSMLPILELRAGLFVAKFLNLPLIKAIPLCIIGNIIPIPLILLFIKKIFKWLGKTKLFHKLVEKLESRAMKKSSALANGEFVGLMLFVGIPIPGTGAWMGSLIAALLEVDFKKAIIAELVGIAIATVIVSILSYGLLGIFI